MYVGQVARRGQRVRDGCLSRIGDGWFSKEGRSRVWKAVPRCLISTNAVSMVKGKAGGVDCVFPG